MYYRAFLVWVLMALAAVLNGAVREKLVSPRLGWQAGHLIATAVLSVVVLALAWLTIGWLAPASAREAVALGAWWLGLTLAFEFLAGHYLFGNPWRQLFADYNLRRGRVWVVVPVVVFLAPLIMQQLHRP
jgi:hypothetical protein